MTDLESKPAPARRAVVVLGMHRSGTSLVAGCLRKLGVDFGPRLMLPNPDNPRGYFEHNDVVNLHDRLLLALNRSWDEVSAFPADWSHDARLAPYRTLLMSLLRRDFSVTPLWGLKDPRLCRLVPWWETVWTELETKPLFVLVRRNPWEIAASLAKREGISVGKAHLLILRHLLEAEQGSRSHERIIVDFADFIADEDAALTPIRRWLGLPPTSMPLATRQVDPSLGKPSVPAAVEPLPPWLEDADAALRLGLAGHEGEMRFRLDRLSDQIKTGGLADAQAITPQSSDLLHQLEMTRRQARWYEEEWRKAQARVDTLQARLTREKERAAQHKKRSSQN